MSGKRKLILGSVMSTAAILSTQAQAQVVINEIYAGSGQNAASIYTKDFIELWNSGSSAFDLSNYSLRYGTSNAGINGNNYVFPSGTIIPAQNYLLIACGTRRTTGGIDFDADLTTTDTILDMNAGSGKVRLADSTVGSGSTLVSGPGILDFVGYGPTASLWEGSGSAPQGTGTDGFTKSVSRNATHTDTNNNATDFTAGTPTPTRTITMPAYVKGDFNFDGGLDFTDINLFVDAVVESAPFTAYINANQAAFQALYPSQTLTPDVVSYIGDFNGDTGLDFTDINPFVSTILGGRSAISVVPEPTSLGLLAVGAVSMLRRRKH